MASKSKRVKVQIKNPTTGEVRTFNFTLTIPASDCPPDPSAQTKSSLNSPGTELEEAVKGASESHLSTAASLAVGLAKGSPVSAEVQKNGSGNGRNQQE